VDALSVIAWNLNPSIILGIAVLAVAYLLAIRRGHWPVARTQVVSFVAGLVVLALALISPLDELSDHYLFTAHMLQHLLLLLVVPSLLLIGLPSEAFLAFRRFSLSRRVLDVVAPPVSAFLLSTAALWIWHTPAVYEAALHDETLHAAEHLCFLVTATLFWWPIARPETYPWPMPELFQFVYLFGAAVSSTMLAALITFSGGILYPTYALGGPYAVIRDALGLTPLADQQVGGLMMWIGGGIWYFGAVGIVLVRLFMGSAPDEPVADATRSSG
jgi:cytochrome c oxidase assembly factor CtaG